MNPVHHHMLVIPSMCGAVYYVCMYVDEFDSIACMPCVCDVCAFFLTTINTAAVVVMHPFNTVHALSRGHRLAREHPREDGSGRCK